MSNSGASQFSVLNLIMLTATVAFAIALLYSRSQHQRELTVRNEQILSLQQAISKQHSDLHMAQKAISKAIENRDSKALEAYQWQFDRDKKKHQNEFRQ